MPAFFLGGGMVLSVGETKIIEFLPKCAFVIDFVHA